MNNSVKTFFICAYRILKGLFVKKTKLYVMIEAATQLYSGFPQSIDQHAFLSLGKNVSSVFVYWLVDEKIVWQQWSKRFSCAGSVSAHFLFKGVLPDDISILQRKISKPVSN